MVIKKKCWPELFEALKNGDKTFDLRLDDFKCKSGDELLLQEFDPKTNKYSGREIKKKISFILHTKDLTFWDKKDIGKKGFMVMGLQNS